MTDPRRHRKYDDARRLLRFLALVVAGVVVFLGIAGTVIPEVVIAIGRNLISPAGLYAASAFRIGVGIVLILAGRESRVPGIFLTIGSLALVSGVATPFFGVEAARARLDWEAANLGILRFEGVAFVLLGGFIVSGLRSARPIAGRE